jgi:hypothetical protein
MRLIFWLLMSLFVFATVPANAELLGDEWITEQEMKRQSAFARQHNLLLVGLRCKFDKDIENPGRKDVLFRADFKIVDTPQAWGWTFDANAPLKGPEAQARAAGFVTASEDYFELTGVTWVRCKVWHRP